MTGFLLDTHIWLWHLRGVAGLPPTLRSLIEAPRDPLWLSPISIWEVALLQRRGRIDLRVPVRRWVERSMAELPLLEAPVNHEVAIVSEEIELPHGDPADRFIAATALVYDLTLLTADRNMTAHGLRTRST
ncbi:MAG: type II toxin-antitoxin system VapC family toxin [Actinomycetota bacterium]